MRNLTKRGMKNKKTKIIYTIEDLSLFTPFSHFLVSAFGKRPFI